MNKVISTNIGGLVFNLDENAYQVLMQYLTELKQKLAHIENNEEILHDIEMRIAELLREKQGDYKEVISLQEVKNVIALLGNPSDYIDEEPVVNSSKSKETHSKGRQFFRDIDNGVIAGVCAGIANYFSADVTLVRIIAILLLIFGGFAVPVYIILWLVAPKAVTSADKLKMKGEPITVESIKKEVKDASERIKNSKFTRDISEKIERKAPSALKKIKQFFGITTIIAVIFVGLFFWFFVFGEYGYYVNDGEEIYSFQQLSSLIFQDGTQTSLGWIAFLIVFIAPMLIFLLFGCHFLFQFRGKWIRKINFTLFFLWLIGIGLSIIVGLQIGRDFTHNITFKSSEIVSQTDTLTIKVLEMNQLPNMNWNEDAMFFVDKNKIQSNNIEVELKKSKDSLTHIYLFAKAYGKSDARALKRAKNIQSEITYANGQLNVSPFMTYPYKDKFRGQELTLQIFTPEETKIIWEGNKELLDFDVYEQTQLIIDENGIKIKHYED